MNFISHQAAQLEITRCLEEPVSDLRTNTEGSLNVFNAAVSNKVKRVVYASSACVYGQARYVPQDELHPTNPNWPYGVSKLAVEKYADIYTAYHGIPMVGLRYSIIYGPREWYGRVLTVFLKRAIEGKRPVIWNGNQVRDFCYVEDAADFHSIAIENEEIESGVFNVSTGIGTTIRQLAETVAEEFQLESPIYEDLREGETSREIKGRKRLPLELKRMVLDNTKARRCGWKPKMKLIQGLSKEKKWLLEHPERWGRMRY